MSDTKFSTIQSCGPGDIKFYIGNEEMIKITVDGFFVKGEKVNDDPEKLYDSFVEWMGLARAKTKVTRDVQMV